MSLPSWQIIPIAIAISFASFSIVPEGLTQSRVLQISENSPPDPPANPPRRNDEDNVSTPGGKLGGPEETCGVNGDRKLTVILPQKKRDNTTASTEPVLWVYAPYPSQKVISGQLRLLNSNQTKYIHLNDLISFTLPNTPGFVGIKMRQAFDDVLIEGESYRWFLTIICQPKPNSEKERQDGIDGVLKIVSVSDETSAWFDRVNRVATGLMEAPGDAALRQEWRELLEPSGLADLADEPIMGPVQIDEQERSGDDL